MEDDEYVFFPWVVVWCNDDKKIVTRKIADNHSPLMTKHQLSENLCSPFPKWAISLIYIEKEEFWRLISLSYVIKKTKNKIFFDTGKIL